MFCGSSHAMRPILHVKFLFGSPNSVPSCCRICQFGSLSLRAAATGLGPFRLPDGRTRGTTSSPESLSSSASRPKCCSWADCAPAHRRSHRIGQHAATLRRVPTRFGILRVQRRDPRAATRQSHLHRAIGAVSICQMPNAARMVTRRVHRAQGASADHMR